MDIGVITSIELNHKAIDCAKKGQEVCIKIEPIPGEAPKMYGRHFEATDIIVSKVSMQRTVGQEKLFTLREFYFLFSYFTIKVQ